MKQMNPHVANKADIDVGSKEPVISKPKILLVDDRPENLFSLEKVLAESGAEMLGAGDGNEALKLTLHHDFALAILDVQMPGMDGYELAEYLRSDKTNQDLPIIFLTAFHSDDQQIFKGYKAGAVDFLTKPYNPKILLAKVNVFLQLDRQKKELEEKLELERSKAFLENILAAMSDAVMVTNQEGTIQKVNLSAQRLLGMNEHEIVDAPIERFFPQNEMSGGFFIVDASPTSRQESILLNAKGERIPISLCVSLFHDTVGNLKGAVFVANDIRQKKIEEENRIHTEKMRALGTMTAGMAHELNNPMMGIIGFAEYCRKHTDAEDKRYEILGDIERETRRCIDIVQNLLTFSRHGKKTQEVLEEISLETIMERVLKLLSYRIERERVSIARNYARPSTPVNINGESIQQVFLNLLVNALDAMDGRETKQISIEIRTDESDVLVELTDTGSGIKQEDLASMFDPFYTTKPLGKGTGLGLSTSLGIIKSHTGTIGCTSTVDVGTTFSVRLPLSFDNDHSGMKVRVLQ